VANPDHLAELNKGVESWNQWRRENPCIVPDLRKADLRQANLRKANLSRADLRKADLSRANLSFADLRGVNLTGAKFSSTCLVSANLSMADLSSANLSKIDLSFANFSRANLRSANLSKTDLKSANFTGSHLSFANLSGANLSEAYLRKAFLREANLSKAILNKANLSVTNLSVANLSQADLNLAVMEGANLQNADLSAVQALRTNFKGAYLTGACLEDWKINSKTALDNVQCDYIYLKKGYRSEFSSRHPSDRTFQSGEFTEVTKQFQQSSETIDLFFTNGITGFLQSFKELQQRCTDRVLAIQEIEPKSDKTLFVRLESLPETNKESAKRFYEEQIQLVQANYALQTSVQLLELSKQHNTEIIELAKLAIGKSPVNNFVNMGASAMSNSEEFTNNLEGANIANFANQVRDNARQQANQYNYSSETQSLADAAKEIQALLDQLSQRYPTDTKAAKRAFANEAIQHIDNDPALAQRILSALGAGSTAALEQFLNHPAASFVINALDDWKKTR
jgi:uncharacterized protein YjbI with pentapeptide repeats